MQIKENPVFRRQLEEMNRCYDPEVQAFHQPFSSPGYHTTLTGGMVHSTRENFQYALMLLHSGVPEYRNRAAEVLKKAISLQDQDPAHDTCGIWPWFYEESLTQMNPPDWNWADFCGKTLCVILHDFERELPEDVRKAVKQSVLCACGSIVKRDAPVSYTNVTLMDCFVTILAGQLMDRPDLLHYGREKLKRIYAHVRENGGFTEYNSPTYTIVALGDLSAMYHHISDKECREYLRFLQDAEWRCIAEHWHVKSAQWTGPHTRCYHSFLEEGLRIKLQAGLPGVKLSEGQEAVSMAYGTDWTCPEAYCSYFETTRESFDVRQFVKDGSDYIDRESVYITPEYTLGSFAVSDFWEQRRNLIAYYGTREAPAYLCCQVLHDGHSFASGELNSVQEKNKVLAMIHFADNAGDEHLVFNKVQNRSITAEDVRIRFEIGGFAGEPPAWREDGTVLIRNKGIEAALSVPYARFGEQAPRFEVTRAEEMLFVDVVLFHGEKETIDLSEIEAAAVLALTVGTAAQPPEVVVEREQNLLLARAWNMRVSGPAVPMAEEQLRQRMRRARNE